jgi:hypothetical protein
VRGSTSKPPPRCVRTSSLLARLRGLDEGLAKVGKVANIKNAPMGSGPVYGFLSGVAHVTQPDVIDALLDRRQVGPDAVGVSPVPHFVEDTAVGLYELHVWELVVLVREMALLHVDLYGTDDELPSIIRRWDVVVDTMMEAGHLRPAQARPG